MRFAYTNADGVVCIVLPASRESIEDQFGPVTDEMFREMVLKGVPQDGDLIELPDDYVFPDRALRAAWKLTKGKIGIDPAKKVEIEAARNAPKPDPIDVQALAARVAALEGRAKP